MSEHEHCAPAPYEQVEPRDLGRLRYHIFVCSDAGNFCGCEKAGSAELLTALRRELARRRLLAQVKVNLMQCRQPGADGPVIVVHPEGVWYDGILPEHVPEFIDRQIVRGEPLAEFLMAGQPQSVTSVPVHHAGT